MYPLSGPPGENEPVPPESSDAVEPVEELSHQSVVWIARLITVGYFGFVAYRLWTDTEVKLHVLHASMRMFQTGARILGRWGIKTEKAYADFVDSLH